MRFNKLDKRTWITLGILLGSVLLFYALVHPLIRNREVISELELEEQRYGRYLKLIAQRPEKEAILQGLNRKSTLF